MVSFDVLLSESDEAGIADTSDGADPAFADETAQLGLGYGEPFGGLSGREQPPR